MLVRKMATVFSNVYNGFIIVNMILFCVSVLNVLQSDGKTFRMHFWFFCVMSVYFWMILILFLLLSICMRMVLYLLSHMPTSDQNSEQLMESILAFPFMMDLTLSEEELIDAVANESLMSPPTAVVRTPPTLDKLLRVEIRWGIVLRTVSAERLVETEDKCLICLQDMRHVFPMMPGVVMLMCSCETMYHKKCIIEWFYFNENEASGTEPALITCPSCRHAFTEEEATSPPLLATT